MNRKQEEEIFIHSFCLSLFSEFLLCAASPHSKH